MTSQIWFRRLIKVSSTTAVLALGYGLASIHSVGSSLPSAVSPSEMAAGGSQAYIQLAEKLLPSVVNISTTQKLRPRSGFGRNGGQRYVTPEELWRHFFGGESFGSSEEDRDDGSSEITRPFSLGSGFVVEAEPEGGLVLTNYHVVDGADEVTVKFTESEDEKESSAQVIGSDRDLDVALLRVKTTRPLQAVVLGDSEKLAVGEWIAALGNPFGHGHSVSHGIVSAKARSLPGGFGQYLQVDAPINPGNSGGPLVNLRGEVVGINNAIDARAVGIGFAIPVNSVKELLPQLKARGKVERGYIGVSLAAKPVIVGVVPQGPADRAGLRSQDLIQRIDGKEVHSSAEVRSIVAQAAIGRRLDVQILRSGKSLTFSIETDRRPGR